MEQEYNSQSIDDEETCRQHKGPEEDKPLKKKKK